MAKQLKCDVLVVGAGPAGARAAVRTASEGLDVILIDSKPRIGQETTGIVENLFHTSFSQSSL